MVLFDKEEVGKRLQQLEEKLGYNSRQFAMEIQGDPSYLSKMEKGKKSLSKPYLEAIEQKFKVNRKWLLYGEGQMFENGQKVPRGTPPTPPNLMDLGTPIYEAGLMIKDKEIVLREYETEGPDFYVQIPQYRDCDYGTRAQGDRMYPEIRNGDLLICKSVDTDMVMYGDVYVLEIKGKVQTCSYVHQAEDQDFYLLKARHEKFPDTVIEKSKITRIWKVRAVFKGL